MTAMESVRDFLSTFPLRGTSILVPRRCRAGETFYPRSPCGERLNKTRKQAEQKIFLSTFPLRGTSTCGASSPMEANFLSTFPLRGTSQVWRGEWEWYDISIHVPLAGNVIRRNTLIMDTRCISIHVPLAGNVPYLVWCNTGLYRFLSTFPLRGTSGRPKKDS